MVKVTWLAHASFLLEGDGLRIITDPYAPNELMNLPPVEEPADIVIRSSDDDDGHCYVDSIPPGFELVTTTHVVETGATAKGLKIDAIGVQESLLHKDSPLDNAMYRFTLGGINFTHMGDAGNPLTDEQLDAMEGTDVLFALAGGPPTIELPDLNTAIKAIKPRIVIPMHYRIPGPRFHMQPVDDLVEYFADEQVQRFDSTAVELSADSLPDTTQLYILQPTLVGEEDGVRMSVR